MYPWLDQTSKVVSVHSEYATVFNTGSIMEDSKKRKALPGQNDEWNKRPRVSLGGSIPEAKMLARVQTIMKQVHMTESCGRQRSSGVCLTSSTTKKQTWLALFNLATAVSGRHVTRVENESALES